MKKKLRMTSILSIVIVMLFSIFQPMVEAVTNDTTQDLFTTSYDGKELDTKEVLMLQKETEIEIKANHTFDLVINKEDSFELKEANESLKEETVDTENIETNETLSSDSINEDKKNVQLVEKEEVYFLSFKAGEISKVRIVLTDVKAVEIKGIAKFNEGALKEQEVSIVKIGEVSSQSEEDTMSPTESSSSKTTQSADTTKESEKKTANSEEKKSKAGIKPFVAPSSIPDGQGYLNTSRFNPPSIMGAAQAFYAKFIPGVTQVVPFGGKNSGYSVLDCTTNKMKDSPYFKSDKNGNWVDVRFTQEQINGANYASRDQDFLYSHEFFTINPAGGSAGKFGVTYKNVGQYEGKTLDLKITILDYLRKENTWDDTLISFGKKKIAIENKNMYWTQQRWEFYKHNTNEPVKVKGYMTINDIDGGQNFSVSPNTIPKIKNIYNFGGDSKVSYEKGDVIKGGLSEEWTAYNGKIYDYTKGETGLSLFTPTSVGACDPDDQRYFAMLEYEADSMEFCWGSDPYSGSNIIEGAYFGYVAKKPARTELISPTKTVSDSNETKVKENMLYNRSEEYTYSINHFVPEEYSEFYYSTYRVEDTVDSALEILSPSTSVKVVNEEGKDVTSQFTNTSTTSKLQMAAKIAFIESKDFYNHTYTFSFKVKVKSSTDLEPYRGTNSGSSIAVPYIKNKGSVTVQYPNGASFVTNTKNTNEVGTLIPDLRLLKIDNNNKLIDVAKFTITAPDGRVDIRTSSSGVVEFPYFVEGTYTIKETAAPVGYEIMANEFHMVFRRESGGRVFVLYQDLTTDGTFKYRTTGNSFSTVPNAAWEAGTNILAIVNKKQTRDIVVQKRWDDNNNAAGLRPATISVKLQRKTSAQSTWSDISGATATLTSSSGVDSISGDNRDYWKGTHTFKDVDTHDASGNRYIYRVVETGIPPYKTSYSPADSNAAHDSKDPIKDAGYFYITNTVSTYDLDIIKQDLDTKDKLNGVTFTVQKQGETEKTYVTSGGSSSNPEGKITLQHLLPGTYTIRETKTVSGYELLESSYTLKINDDGTVSPDTNASQYYWIYERTGSTNQLKLTVNNREQVQLPATGGPGNHLLINIMIVLSLCVIAILIRKYWIIRRS